MVTLWRRVMTPFQAARISVTAYPIIQVDMLAVVKCAPRQPWCPPTQHVLCCDAMSPISVAGATNVNDEQCVATAI